MQISHTYTVEAEPAAVLDALLSTELNTARMEKFSISDYEFNTDGAQATLDITVAADRLPKTVGKLLRSGAQATLTMRREDDVVHLEVSTKVPVKVELTLRVAPQVDGTTSAVQATGEVSVNMPLIGSKIEDAVSQRAARALESDAALIAKVAASK
ncbi:Protein of unknown function [Actinobaculum suis]|uniref:DUF2505 domain-containing protein n=1 Tax=Actinobaculum suis TaxID=1657 RepID=A0A1G7DFP2_9ACTO|nr:DUF2505 domain-containing protein [Actinobaculum suis]MDY5154093.1 DUF2505 domain-containing protein [Actinobaculum suis]SDE50337.1 Protein of unknown function [Actinobaculum suis]